VARNFPDWIAAYLSLVEGRTEAPRAYSYWSAVATIAAALTRNIWRDEIRFKLYPNFLIVLAGKPGVLRKSTTIDECTRILREIDDTLFGPDETTWPDLCATLASRVRHRLIGVEHADPLDNEYLAQCAMTLSPGEFGTFFKPNDEAMVTGMTALWDAGDRVYIKSTKTSGVDHIQNPFLNTIGAATAKWLQDNFRQFTGWGIASRIIFVHSDEETAPIWSPAALIRERGLAKWHSQRSALQDDLRLIMELYGECIFTPEAATIAKRWYEDNVSKTLSYVKRIDADPWVSDFLGRKQAHVHKLAMVLSASRRDTLLVTEEDFTDAVHEIDAVEEEIKRVFSIRLVQSPAAAGEQAAYDYLHEELSNGLNGRAEKRLIVNMLSAYVDGATAERILTTFVRRGILHEETTPRGSFVILPPKRTEETTDVPATNSHNSGH